MTTTPAPLDLDAIRAEYDQLRPESGELADNIPKLIAELEQMRADAGEAFVQRLVDETTLKSLDFRNGKASMDMGVAREIAAAMVAAARTMLGDAPNYTETKVELDVKVAESPELYTFVVQRHAPGALTPHEARQKAEAERDAAREELAKVSAELAEQRSKGLTYLANQGNLNLRLERELAQARAQMSRVSAFCQGVLSEAIAPTEYQAVMAREVLSRLANPATTAEPADEPDGEPLPGTFWERSVIERFINGTYPNVNNVRLQVAAMLAELRPGPRPVAPVGSERMRHEAEPADQADTKVTVAFDKPTVCGHGCTTWCTTANHCPLDEVEPADEPKATCGCPRERKVATVTRHSRECHMASVARDMAAAMEGDWLDPVTADPTVEAARIDLPDATPAQVRP